MPNFSCFIKGENFASEIDEEVVELLPKATYVSMFAKDASELTADLIEMVVSFGFITDGVIGETKVEPGALTKKGEPVTPSSFVNFKRPVITAASLAQARARMLAKKRV